jgi:hypothetical protein
MSSVSIRLLLLLRNRLLLGEALLVVSLVRSALWLIPFPRWRSLLLTAYREEQAAALPALYRVSWAVQTAAMYVPAATCLTQAIALHLMLRRRRYHSTIRIGVARGQNGALEAHAWVASAEQVLIGGNDTALARYAVFPQHREPNQ